MIWLLLAILSSTIILILFKLLKRYNIPTLNVIIVNYLTASVLGFLLTQRAPASEISLSTWFLPAVGIAVIFIVSFFLIAYSSQNIGISVTSVAAKMSVIVPVAFSIIYYQEPVNTLKIAGMVLALFAVFISVYRKEREKFVAKSMLIPVAIFLLMGTCDSLIKFAQGAFVPDDVAPVFSASIFAVAFVLGLVYIVTKPSQFTEFRKLPVWWAGILLGAVNFGSVYFIILALNSRFVDGSIVFGVVNIGVVGLSVIIGKFAFAEKLSALNFAGVILAVTSIVLLMLS